MQYRFRFVQAPDAAAKTRQSAADLRRSLPGFSIVSSYLLFLCFFYPMGLESPQFLSPFYIAPKHYSFDTSIIAPVSAELTKAAYLANAGFLGFTTGTQPSFLLANSSSDTSIFKVRLWISISITSPS